MLKKLVYKAGVNREGTNYTNEGTFWSTEKVRFRSGCPEKLGGWIRYSASQFIGIARAMINWVSLTGQNIVGIGTELKYVVEIGGSFTDITPIRASSVINNNPFIATNGSAVVAVTDTAHGAVDGDYVTFSGTAGLGGVVTNTVLNAEYKIAYVDGDHYNITLSVTANATDAAGSPGGGAGVTAAYQINTGLNVQIVGVGWGAGVWGRGGWGSAATVGVGQQLRTWAHDNFGEDLVFNVRTGGVYYYDTSAGGRGVALSALGGAAQAPTIVNHTLVSSAARHVVAVGCDMLDGSGAFDPLLIRWSDSENAAVWQPLPTNTAGDLRMQNGSISLAALQTRQEILIWTDKSLYSLQYVGAPLVFGLNVLGDSHGIMGPRACINAEGTVYWMSSNRFYTYNGQIQQLPCTLWAHVFKNLNYDQAFQVFAATNARFSEVWWFYCSEGSTTVDSYVIYNYLEDTWVYGSMARTMWVDSGLRQYPMATDYNSRILYHEASIDDESGLTAAPISSSIEAADIDIDDGDRFGFVDKMIPDIDFQGSTVTNPSVDITLIPRNFPGQAQGASTAKTVTATAVSEDSLYTNEVFVRVRGRQMAFRITSATLGVQWQLGTPRINVRIDGRKV